MADIFISYSSKDREKAEQLTELLSSAGLSVWIDQSGIDAATSWSSEIVDAIDNCKALVVLLSPNSVISVNVVKEVSLAAEQKKKILPLDLEPIELPREFRYHLAGIQRTSMTNIDSIIRALGRLGLEATQAPTLKLVKETDSRKSLMILPFEDLSPTADNQWFADGIVSEMISSLSNVKALKVMDAQTTKEFKKYTGHLTVYAKEMGIRYFVQGDVRKFGDSIKITSRLLDIETGDYLWQDSLKGTMDDIFDIQETVAKNVVEGLNVILTKDEEKKLEQKPTENAEAYELWLKGNEYYARHTRSDLERALGLFEESARLDPGFADAHTSIAGISLSYYRQYSRDSQLLVRAGEHIETAASLLGETERIYWIRSFLASILGNFEESLQLALRSVELDPEFVLGYDALGFAYKSLGRSEESANAWERQVQILGNDRIAHFSYLVALNDLGDTSRLVSSAGKALPLYERYLRLTPDDLNARVQYATILGWAGDHERSLIEAHRLESTEGLDGNVLYNLACIYLNEGDNASGIHALRKSVEHGLRNIDTFRRDPDLAPLRGMPEFEELMRELEELVAKEKKA